MKPRFRRGDRPVTLNPGRGSGEAKSTVRVQFEAFALTAATVAVVVRVPDAAMREDGGLLQPIADQLTGILLTRWTELGLTTPPPLVIFARSAGDVHFDRMDVETMATYGWAPVAEAGRVAGQLRDGADRLRQVAVMLGREASVAVLEVAGIIDEAVGGNVEGEALTSLSPEGGPS